MEPRMYRAEPSLVMNAERSGPKLPLCPSCAQNMRLIRRTQRFGELPDVCTFECPGCGVSHFEEYAAETKRPVIGTRCSTAFHSVASRVRTR
jgi:C4-type Zn-finger protein